MKASPGRMRDNASDEYAGSRSLRDRSQARSLAGTVIGTRAILSTRGMACSFTTDGALRGLGKGEATDAELLELFAKMIKQREESEKIYADAGRADLAKQEAEEIAIIREYLPKQLSETDTQNAIAEAIAETGASSVKDMGKVMAALKSRHAGQMDFAKASALVRAKLG